MPYNIIPLQGFPEEKGTELDKRAIAFWLATGFMLDRDSFYTDVKWQRPEVDGPLWFYEPKEISLAEATDRFAELFEAIVKEQTVNRKALLALSGGLDSRTLAVALRRVGADVHSYSYRFAQSFHETKYGKAIAKKCGWTFDDLEIPPGYLWGKIDEAPRINGCYAEFSHARQWAVAEELAKKGDFFMLGHWGDVLFDDMGVADDLSFEPQVQVLKKKVLKKGGSELAADLWKHWGFEGDFIKILEDRLTQLHSNIDIDSANARIRAFKSTHWATRWTTTNLKFFSHFAPMELPYYDDRMCRFICEIPEKHLAGRQIQIEYIKKYAPDLAAIPWQSKEPYNLYNYHKHLTSVHLPWRIQNKVKNVWRNKIVKNPITLRNWEIQFLGDENEAKLKQYLFENEALLPIIPKEIIERYYALFKQDGVQWSHPVSMILTAGVMLKDRERK